LALLPPGVSQNSYKDGRPMSALEVSQDGKGLFFGGYEELRSHLDQTGVGAVVNLTPTEPLQEQYGCGSKILEHVPCEDTLYFNVCQHFDRVCDFIDEQERRGVATYVHCRMGVNRAMVFAMACLMRRHFRRTKRHSMESTLAALSVLWANVSEKRGHHVLQNPSFQAQLVLWILHGCDSTEVERDPNLPRLIFHHFAMHTVLKECAVLERHGHKQSCEDVLQDILRCESKLLLTKPFHVDAGNCEGKVLLIRERCRAIAKSAPLQIVA